MTDWTDTQSPLAKGVTVGLFIPGNTSMISSNLSFGCVQQYIFLAFSNLDSFEAE